MKNVIDSNCIPNSAANKRRRSFFVWNTHIPIVWAWLFVLFPPLHRFFSRFVAESHKLYFYLQVGGPAHRLTSFQVSATSTNEKQKSGKFVFNNERINRRNLNGPYSLLLVASIFVKGLLGIAHTHTDIVQLLIHLSLLFFSLFCCWRYCFSFHSRAFSLFIFHLKIVSTPHKQWIVRLLWFIVSLASTSYVCGEWATPFLPRDRWWLDVYDSNKLMINE